MKKQIKCEDTTDKPVLLLNFLCNWDAAHNALFLDDGGQFYTGFDNEGFENLKPVSICEALRWYTEAMKYSDGLVGCIDDLCNAAAKELDRLATLNPRLNLN